MDELLLSDWYGKVAAAASREALRHGRALTILPELESPAALAAFGLDGAILLNPTANDPRVRLVTESGTPVVLLGKDPSGALGPSVVPATAQGMRELLEHLWAKGARSIAIVKTDIDWSEGRAAVSAFRSWCRARGARSQVATAAIARSTSREQTTAAAQQTALRILSSAQRPDAVIGLLEDFGRGILAAAAALGLGVPQDILVAQDTDGVVAQLINPPLTALDLNLTGQMAQAMQLLVEHNSTDPRVTIKVPVTLRVRESTLRG